MSKDKEDKDKQAVSAGTKIKLWSQAILVIAVVLSVLWGFFWIDGRHDAIPFATAGKPVATSTVEISLEGVEDKKKLRELLRLEAKQTKLEMQDKEIEAEMSEVKREKTSLE